MKVFYPLAMVLSLVLCSGIAAAQAEQPVQKTDQADWARAVSPEENSVVIEKKPVVRVEFLKPVAAGTLVIMLDGTDVTQMSSVTDKGFEYKPVMVLAPGAHTLNMMAKDREGLQLQKAVSFTTRHSQSFEEARSDNELSLLYETPLKKPRFAGSVPDSRVEGNLRSDTKLRDKEWEMKFSTNLRYFDQNSPVSPPFNKGISIANYLLQSKYSKDLLQVIAEVGDVQVNETQNTAAGLARRGGRFAVQYKDFTFNTFIVKGMNVLGFHGGLGMDNDLNDHIFGMSAGIKLLDKKVEFKTIYLTGGEPGSSPGISTTPGSKKGDVLGLVLTTDFFQNRLKSEFEADFSSFDPDSSDEFKARSDKAYRARLSGAEGRYVYDAAFEYFGRDYASIGSQGTPRDRTGFMAHGGANYEMHDINITFSQYHDNVKEDVLFPRIINYTGMIDYNFRLIPNTPLGISYSKSIQDSSKEPAGSNPMELHTDTISGRISRSIEKLNFMFMTAYSSMNDKTPVNNDSTIMTYTLTPSFSTGKLMISSNLQLNQSKIRATDVRTDTYTLTLDLRTRFLNDKASFDANTTYSIIKTDNHSTDTKNLNASFRLGYILKDLFSGLIKPNIALRGSYMKVTDRINAGLNRDDFSLFLVLSTVTPFSL